MTDRTTIWTTLTLLAAIWATTYSAAFGLLVLVGGLGFTISRARRRRQ